MRWAGRHCQGARKQRLRQRGPQSFSLSRQGAHAEFSIRWKGVESLAKLPSACDGTVTQARATKAPALCIFHATEREAEDIGQLFSFLSGPALSVAPRVGDVSIPRDHVRSVRAASPTTVKNIVCVHPRASERLSRRPRSFLWRRRHARANQQLLKTRADNCAHTSLQHAREKDP